MNHDTLRERAARRVVDVLSLRTQLTRDERDQLRRARDYLYLAEAFRDPPAPCRPTSAGYRLGFVTGVMFIVAVALVRDLWIHG